MPTTLDTEMDERLAELDGDELATALDWLCAGATDDQALRAAEQTRIRGQAAACPLKPNEVDGAPKDPERPNGVEWHEIVRASCAVFGMHVSSVYSDSRNVEVVATRSTAWLAARTLDRARFSYPKLAQLSGRKDKHTTVITSVQKLNDRCEAGEGYTGFKSGTVQGTLNRVIAVAKRYAKEREKRNTRKLTSQEKDLAELHRLAKKLKAKVVLP